MENTLTQTLNDFEALVTKGDIKSFQVSIQKPGLWIQTGQGGEGKTIALPEDMYDSLHSFFYGVDKIEYRSHDYTNLKCFINARVMLDRLLKKEAS